MSTIEEKKKWVKPKLHVFGDITEITEVTQNGFNKLADLLVEGDFGLLASMVGF